MKPLILTMLLTFGLAGAASAENVCMAQDEMHAALIDWYGERPVAEPTQANEQVWASERTGTWTMVKSHADGTACVTAQGDDWTPGEDMPPLLAQIIGEDRKTM